MDKEKEETASDTSAGRVHDDLLAWSVEADSMQDTLILASAEDVVLYTNCHTPGKTYEESVGCSVFELFPAEYHESLRRLLDDVFQRGVSGSAVVSATAAGDGSRTIWKRISTQPLGIREQVDLAVIHIEDVTRMKEEERALSRVCAKLLVALNAVDKPEEIVTVCAWSKKIKMDGQWMSLEDFLRKRFGVKVSHGIAEEELMRQIELLAAEQSKESQ